MVGITLGQPRELLPRTFNTDLGLLSLCSVGLPFPIKSWFTRHSHDDMLDFLWQVRLSFAPVIVYKAHGAMQCLRLRFKQGLCNPWRHRTQEECLSHRNRPPDVRLTCNRGGIAHTRQVHLRDRLSPQLIFDCGPLFRCCPIRWVYSTSIPSLCRDYIRLLGTLLLIVLLWFGISAPLSAIGAYLGSTRGVRPFCSISTFFFLLFSQGHLSPCQSPCHPSSNPATPKVLTTVGMSLSLTDLLAWC